MTWRPSLSAHRGLDLIRTLALWAYFTLGYLVFFFPVYLGAYLLAEDRQAAFQKLNHLFFKLFFRFLGWLIPGVSWRVSPEVRTIRGAVIVCNHRSYLDPILLISLFERQKTIVKAVFFKIPIFRWGLRHAGYIPASARGELASRMLEEVESLESFLAVGGNLFVFPEGTRGVKNATGRLEKGAFRLAKRCGAPVEILWIENTEKLFPPGRFLFDTRRPVVISVRRLGRISPEAAVGIADRIAQVSAMFAEEAGRAVGAQREGALPSDET